MSELAAPPALDFTVAGAEPSSTRRIRACASTCWSGAGGPRGLRGRAVHADPHRPGAAPYGDAERERLVELFGPPERWGATTHSFQWARVESLVPSFTGSTPFTIEVQCTYDLEVASAKYFDSLRDGQVPLCFHFNGTVLYRGADDRLQVVLVPWSCSASWRLPVEVWRRTIDAHYPGGGWIRLQRETLDALARRKAERGLHSFDDTVRELL